MLPENIKHLEFIQNAITRLNTNSFQIKGWSIIIVSALLTLYTSTNDHYIFLIGVFPTIIFWFLDSFYLHQERKFRGLYNDVAGVTDNPKEIKLFEMQIDSYTGGQFSFWNAFFSITILKLYLPTALILIGTFIYFEFFTNKGI